MNGPTARFVWKYASAKMVLSFLRNERFIFQIPCNRTVSRPQVKSFMSKRASSRQDLLRRKEVDVHGHLSHFTPENIVVVRRPVPSAQCPVLLYSPEPCYCGHTASAALHLADRSVRKIFHEIHRFHPYKIVVTQREWHNRFETNEIVLEI